MSFSGLKPFTFRIWLALVWLLLTLAMVLWWWSLGLGELKATVHDSKYRMLMWEGIFFCIFILVGGGSLLWLLLKDQQRQKQMQNFFSAFSHDLKTSISRLRLQADVLREQSQQKKNPQLERLARDISRLDLQLENSLFYAQDAERFLIEEKIPISKLIESLKSEWEDLEIILEKEAFLKGDRKALLSVFRNLVQNAVIHGGADQIRVEVQESSRNAVLISMKDNGKGYQGLAQNLGKNPLSGTQGQGLGLYLCRSMLIRMQGNLEFESASNHGFSALMTLKGDL